jgi:hypothetical protein
MEFSVGTGLLAASEHWPAGLLVESEREGWRLAIDALDAGLIGYVRIVARRPSAAA